MSVLLFKLLLKLYGAELKNLVDGDMMDKLLLFVDEKNKDGEENNKFLRICVL